MLIDCTSGMEFVSQDAILIGEMANLLRTDNIMTHSLIWEILSAIVQFGKVNGTPQCRQFVLHSLDVIASHKSNCPHLRLFPIFSLGF